MPLRDDVLVPPVNPLPPLAGLGVHVLGIRGRGMAPVALAAKFAGADVDGCDIAPAASGDPFAPAGISVALGNDPTHVAGRHLVVTTLIHPDSPEVAAVGRDRLHHRTDLLAAVLRDRVSVAVTGSHGKGTVAALIGCALDALGDDPLVMLGVRARALGGSFRAGRGPAVAEADDADGTIARIPATISVVTNSWSDHPMLGRTRTEVLHDIGVHVAKVPADGRVILGRRSNLTPLIGAARAPVWRLGRDFDVETLSVETEGRVLRFRDPETGADVTGRVRIHGGEIADNAALAFAALRATGAAPASAAAALEALDGLDRRLELVGEAGGVRVFDDFGKHPESMAATLAAARDLRPRQLHVVYEPNLHADVLRWGRRWAAVLAIADTAVVLPVDMRATLAPARRAPADWALRAGARADRARTRDEAVDLVVARCRPGDVVVVCGINGDLVTVSRALLQRLAAAG